MGRTGQSGTFQGHLIPAICFMGFGLFFLFLSLKRARSLAPGQSFCAHFIPEKSISLMRVLAVVILVLTTCGILYEGIGGCYERVYKGCLLYHASHEILYLVYGAVAPVLLLESSGRLPPDSSRASLALALLLAYVLWNEHALMKRADPTDYRVHVLMANLCLVTAAVFGFSIWNPANLPSYIAGWGLFVLKACWLLSAGINADYHKIDIHLVGPLFCFEVIVVTLSIVFVGALFGSQNKQGYNRDRSISARSIPITKEEYEVLRIGDDGDVVEDEPSATIT